ncbi:MAG: hypothetical protein U0Z75_00205 [Deinococcaceae bacterium]
MKWTKWVCVLALGLPLSSCANGDIFSYDFRNKVGIAINAKNSDAFGIVKRSQDDKGKISDTVEGPRKAIEFIFTSLPGSQAAYITGYRIERYILNGEDLTQYPPEVVQTSNIYIPSGFTCSKRSEGNSCKLTDKDTYPGNVEAPTKFYLNTIDGLIGLAQENAKTYTLSMNLAFFGTSATGEYFEFEVTGISSSASFSFPR